MVFGPRAFYYALTLVFCCTGCGGGGSSNAPIVTATASPIAQTGTDGAGSTPALDRSINFTVAVPAQAPAASVTKRKIAHGRPSGDTATTTPYISANTASISIALVAVDGISFASSPPAPTIANITCTTPATGCSVVVSGVVAAVGTNRYEITTYTLPGGPSTPNNVTISSDLIDVVVNANGAVNTTLGNPADLAIGGYVASLALSVTQNPNPLVFGMPGSGSVLVIAKDVAGATIVGNTLFPNPITVSARGVQLSGSGIATGGTDVLSEPESATTLIGYTYDGTASGIVFTATTTSSSGTSISAPQVTIAPVAVTPAPTASPVPTPTPTPFVLPPGASPTPKATASPHPSPTPVLSPIPKLLSLYVLDAGNNTVVEYPLSTGGFPTSAPRRIIGGSDFGCPSSLTQNSDPDDGGVGASDYGFGVTGLTVDPNTGTVYAGASGDTCAPAVPNTLYAISAAATGMNGVGHNSVPVAQSADADVGLLFDPTANVVDFYPGASGQATLTVGGSFENYSYLQLTYSGTSGGVAKLANAIGTDPSTGEPCTNSSGFGTAQTGCVSTNPANNSGPFFVAGGYLGQSNESNSVTSAPLSVDGNGTTYQAEIDEQSFPNFVGISSGLVALSDSANVDGPSGTRPAVAASTWTEGLDTELDPFNSVAAMTYDPTTSRLYVLENAADFYGTYWQAVNASSGASQRPDLCQPDAAAGNPPSCSDGDEHYYIVGFAMNAPSLTDADCIVTNTNVCDYPAGALDPQPALVISGDALHLPPSIDVNNDVSFPSNLVPQSAFTSSNGRLYLANILGATCNVACVNSESNPLSTTQGEIDVYDGTATGYFDNSTPGSVFLGAFASPEIGVPVGVAVGPQGSATMTVSAMASVRANATRPHNLPSRRRASMRPSRPLPRR